jgi:uncharacterized cofD-like protein
VTGDFSDAVKFSSEVLAIVGRIFPSTSSNVSLEARLADGATLSGETRISRSKARIESVTLRPRQPKPLDETLAAIAGAHLITLGPGSLFTSVIPNLLVKGVPEAIEQSPALKAYFVNLMWQPGETMGFTAWDHVEAIQRHAGRRVVDTVVVNTRPITGQLRKTYAAQKVFPVENDVPRIEGAGLSVVGEDLLAASVKVRHDPARTAAVAVRLAEEVAKEQARQTRVARSG